MTRRVLVLTTVHPRSDTRIFVKEARTLASVQNYEVVLLVADGKGNEEIGKLSVQDVGRLSGGRILRMVRGSLKAFRAIRKLKPDIVHFHDPELIPVCLLLWAMGTKVIYDVHEDLPGQTLSKHYLPRAVRRPLAWFTASVEWCAAKVFNGIVPATPKIAERFPPSKTVTIHNYPIISELLTLSPTPYAERPNAFAYAGVIAQVRGTEEMVSALELLEDIPDVRLDLAGTFSPTSFAKSLQARPGWKSVNYYGEVTRQQVAELLGGCRAGLVVLHPVPNKVDALPIKLFEYMSVGLPVIGADFSTLRHIIEGEECGLTVPPLDADALAEAMRWILEHPEEAEAMGQRGRKAVERSYNWDVEATRLLEFYDRLLSI